MKDRYLHRARRVDSGEWVYGTLAIKGTAMFIIGEIQDYSDEYIYPEFWWKVIPETVGQCAGQVDKRGELIYEGDVGFHREWELRFKVIWNNQLSIWLADFDGEYEHLFEVTECCEVIGNIHENPELLPELLEEIK